MTSVEVSPDTIQYRNGRWQFVHPVAHSGGALFAVTAEWCGHCNALKRSVPQAQKLSLFDFFWLDGDKSPAHQQKAQQMGIEGFPSMYFIERNGYLTPYNGGRSPEQLARVFHKH